jgi:hypothetical protein
MFLVRLHHGLLLDFAPEQSMEFDARGRTRRPTAPSREGVASLQYKGKTLAISQRGRIAIRATGPNDVRPHNLRSPLWSRLG